MVKKISVSWLLSMSTSCVVILYYSLQDVTIGRNWVLGTKISIIFYNHMWIYNYLKIKKIKRKFLSLGPIYNRSVGIPGIRPKNLYFKQLWLFLTTSLTVGTLPFKNNWYSLASCWCMDSFQNYPYKWSLGSYLNIIMGMDPQLGKAAHPTMGEYCGFFFFF